MKSIQVFMVSLLLATVICTDKIVYYVQPTSDFSNSTCPGQHCHTLDDYLSTSNDFFKDGGNITMNVMEGNHIVSAKHAVINNLHSFKLIADMNISETPKIFIGSDIQWNFSNITEVYIGHLMIISEKKGWGSVHAWSPPSLNGTLTIDSCELDNVLTVLTYTNLVLKGSVSFSKTTSRLDSPFEGTIFVIRGTMTTDALGSVTFVHSQTPIFSCFSSVILTGSITFENNSNTAIIAYSSSVTMSGNISLTYNTGIQGGAMQLHSSRLNIGSGTNVFFSGNTASETGGAIYVDYPSLLNNGVPFKTCFYRLLNYNEAVSYTHLTLPTIYSV